VRADGRNQPFPDATFDVVMMIQIFGGMTGFRLLVAEARRVLRLSGAVVLGRTLAAEHGVDARLKQRLALILSEIGIGPGHNFHDEIEQALKRSDGPPCLKHLELRMTGFLKRSRVRR